MTAPIRPATAAEIPAVGRLIARAFDHLPQNRSLVPDDGVRLAVMAAFFTLLSGSAREAGAVDVIEDASGSLVATAVWFDRTRDLPEIPDYEQRLRAVAGRWLPHFAALDELFEKHHPQEPHWHLAFLAVDRTHQGAGLGSALMQHTHDRLEAPAYLEATNDDNVRLYRRHGYADMSPFDIHLPDGTPFFRMWRP
ncbi:GNAT family N-acetyltransferase [Couchioplanes caeruleus]|uniref:GNAT family N-acetyltransferase n=2 Tax=Couchioplanes caeruleus TaxID=56438 RepID=A0A1K0GTN5_9ACTN|nr:GNAT family N-acetyltransferase [Couchioplanes caeruleus]OJF14644.1 GNAT family N-acetyltransferase [Couchioplanes caeruleus subsp. caeruleus]ROP34442.1 acetyltransferase (GNAT) family protein [Couchioplanes caeruleus]